MQSKFITKAEWTQVAEKGYVYHQSLLQNPGWKQIDDSPCLKFKLEQGSKILSKGYKVISGYSIDHICDFILDPKNITAIFPNCSDIKILDTQGDARLIYIRMKGIWPVSDREVVGLQTFKKDGGVYQIVIQSVNHDYPTNKDLVRADAKLVAFFLEKVDDKTVKVTHTADVDPAGDIPEVMKAKAATMRGQVPANLQKALRGK